MAGPFCLVQPRSAIVRRNRPSTGHFKVAPVYRASGLATAGRGKRHGLTVRPQVLQFTNQGETVGQIDEAENYDRDTMRFLNAVIGS
jgi:hypothetical protein